MANVSLYFDKINKLISTLLLFMILADTTLASKLAYDYQIQQLRPICADKSFLKFYEPRLFIPARWVNFWFTSCAENKTVTHIALFHSFRAV